MSDHDDGHDGHDHSHHEAPRSRRARSEFEIRAMALEAALVEAGRTSTDAIDAFVEHLEHRMGPHHGARVVARAWTDPAFKDRLLADGTTAVAELGIAGAEGDNVRVVENTESVHHLVVCTLCSCYPWPVLGLPPAWYKDPAYRARIVREPRTLLAEMGLTLGDDVEINVWDSSSEVRYFVLPERPEGTDDLSEEELATLVTRDAMVGVARVPAPVA